MAYVLEVTSAWTVKGEAISAVAAFENAYCRAPHFT